jgi:hypothetical protein
VPSVLTVPLPDWELGFWVWCCLCIFADCARCRAGSVAFWSWPFIFVDSLATSAGPASVKPSAMASMFLHNAGNAGPDHQLSQVTTPLSDVQVSRSPPRASPSAGSCVPAIGYPYMGPGALAGGPGSRAPDRRFHGQFRSAANAGAAEKGISVSMMCDCEGRWPRPHRALEQRSRSREGLCDARRRPSPAA